MASQVGATVEASNVQNLEVGDRYEQAGDAAPGVTVDRRASSPDQICSDGWVRLTPWIRGSCAHIYNTGEHSGGSRYNLPISASLAPIFPVAPELEGLDRCGCKPYFH